MCVIVDANVAHNLYSVPVTEAAAPLADWIENRGGRIVYGGKLAVELTQTREMSRWLRVLMQAGRAVLIIDPRVDDETGRLEESGSCVSDDSHIIALARIVGARLLYSHDRDLHADFRNPDLINAPRGHIYQNEGHRRLLTNNTCRAK